MVWPTLGLRTDKEQNSFYVPDCACTLAADVKKTIIMSCDSCLHTIFVFVLVVTSFFYIYFMYYSVRFYNKYNIIYMTEVLDAVFRASFV